jgi:TonB family protein
MAAEQTGIFYAHHKPSTLKEFPREFRGNLWRRLDRRFVAILSICAVVLGVATFVLSLRPVKEEATEQEILRIQERYAQLVLNQPAVKEPEKVERAQTPDESASKSEERQPEAEQEEIDREKESFAEKQQRKEASRQERARKREEVRQQVASSGIFAAITAAGGSGGGAVDNEVTDLLGAASEGLGDMENIDISRGTFAAKKVDPAVALAPRGEKTSGVGIKKQKLGKAQGSQIASAGAVNVTSEEPPEISGESAGSAGRSQSAIARVINRERSRLVRVYENWLKRDPALGGQLKIKFTILPDGSVTNVSIVKSTTNNADFDSNIIRYVKRWRFPADEGGSPTEVVYPFVFEGTSS